MADFSNIPTGLKITSQIPLDVKGYALNEATLSYLGVDDNLAYTYHEGITILCIEEKTIWQWREVLPGEENTGLIPLDFTYPLSLDTVYGIDYSGRTFNFFELKYINIYNINESVNVNNVGSGIKVYKGLNAVSDTHEFKTLYSSDDSITIEEDDDMIDFKSSVLNTDFSKNNLQFDDNRIHDLNSKTVHYNNAKQIKSTVNVIQPIGEASFEEKGFGSTITDVIKRIFNGASEKIVEIFGNKSVKFYGNIWSNGLSNLNSNTVFGQDAFTTNSIGVRNTAFGTEALKNANSNDNSAFGNSALKELTTGIQNTAIGFEAANSVTTGVQNVAIGYDAMYKSQGASSFNTVLGFSSLSRTEDEVFTTTSNHCTIIGNSIKTKSGNLNPINQIIIGSDAIGKGDNTIVLGNEDSEVLYLPEHTTTEINAFTGMTKGAVVFNTTLNTLCFYNGTTWQKVTTTNM